MIQQSDVLQARIREIMADLGLSEEYVMDAEALDNFRHATARSADSGKTAVVRHFMPRSGSVKLIPLYDIHYGLVVCNKELLRAYLDLIYKTEDCYTIIGGDSLENATKTSIGRGWLEEDIHGGEQRRRLTDMLRPLAEAEKILGVIPGNHELRSANTEDDDGLQEIAYDLGVPYCGYQGYFCLYVNDILYRVFTHHGKSFAVTKGGKANAAIRPAGVADADLYITGHTHERMVLEDTINTIGPDGSVVSKRRVYVVGGSLVGYFNAYAEMELLNPSFNGAVLISLLGDTKYISVTL